MFPAALFRLLFRLLFALLFRPLPLLALIAILGLAGCKSSEERAADYYRSAQEYLQKGDADRALVELRNVFKYDPRHKEARLLFADTLLAQGDIGGAYGQYLRLAEQYPNLVPVRLTLAELALSVGDWDETARHGKAALELAPDEPRAQALQAAIDYHAAVKAGEPATAARAAARAEELLAAHPDLKVARRVAIDARLTGDDPQSAMPLVEAAIAQDPKEVDYRLLRYRLLVEAGDTAAAGQELETAYAQHPDDAQLRNMLVSWYYSQGNLDGAEALLRRLTGPDDGPTEGHVALVQFLARARGAGAAGAELDRLIGATEGLPQQQLYSGMRASMRFEAGEHDAAIAEMRKILAAAKASDQTRELQLSLARMLAATGDQVGARELVETVLAGDPGQVDALKMRAAWLIRDDQPEAAIVDLRTALNGAPRDADILLLMAEAHERAGARDLAGERLALAVDVSNSAPQVALRYAGFLMQGGRVQSAETVLATAHDLHPEDLSLAKALADLWLRQQNWPRLQVLLGQLRNRDGDDARSLYSALQAAVLLGQNRTDEGLEYLQKQFAETGTDRALTLLVMTRLRNGEADRARALVADALKDRPDEPALRLLAATVEAVAGNVPEAETRLRALIADRPDQEAPVRMLVSLLVASGRAGEAAAVLDGAPKALAASDGLRMTRATLYEKAGDFEAAIALYEQLYAENSSNLIVANNLASLLADRRSDPESLDRAYAVARRLRGLAVPAFQDTYGWIVYRRGDAEEALLSLEPAARSLPDDPLAQVHLGLAYDALGREDEAREPLRRALQLAPDNPLPQFEEARKVLDRIGAEPPAPAPE